MKLEDQVVSLELAKEMKDLGFEQESLYIWQFNDLIFNYEREDYENYYKAYTVAELGEMLPLKISIKKYYTRSEWRCVDQDDNRSSDTQVSYKAADAMAKMLIYLKKEGLLK